MRESSKADTHCSGFTILEVLVAVTILAMMSMIIFGALFYTASSVEQLEERAALYHRAGFILVDISRSVTSAYAPYAGTYIDAAGSGRDIFLATGDPFGDGQAGYLSTFTTNPRLAAGAPGTGIAYVSYELIEATEFNDAPGWIEDENNPLVLHCDVEPLLSAPGGGDGHFTSWALNVRSLNFEYFDGAAWMKEWSYEDQEAFPAAVKVELELGDSSGESHAYSTIAYVRANAPLEEPPGAASGSSQTGTASGSSQTGTASGSSQAGTASGSSQTGTASGSSQTGTASGSSQPSSSPGGDGSDLFGDWGTGTFP